ncbi:MAG: SGNH/GDSL hydrolase family protein [Fimbriimonas sp.]
MRRSNWLAISALCLSTTFGHAQQPNQYEEEVQKLVAQDAKQPPKPGGVVFVGSSSVRLWKTLATDFPKLNVINSGFGGSEISDSVYFAKRIVTPYKPKMVVLFAGTNDVANGKAPETIVGSFREFVSTVRRELPKARIAYIAISPAASRFDKIDAIRRTNALIQAECSKGKNLVFINTFPHLLTADGQARPELFVEDRLHLNAEGYALVRTIVGPYLPKASR